MRHLQILGILLVWSGVVWAAPNNTISIPNDFVSGQTADADQVDANFTEVKNKYDVHTHNTLSGLTTLQIPASNAPTVSNDGEIALELDEDGLNLQAGSNTTGGIPTSTDVKLPLLQMKSITILEPDLVQAVSDAVPWFAVDSYNFPAGITVTAIRLATSASSSVSYNIEEWTSPTDGSPATIDAIATSSSTEKTETTITDASVAVGGYVMIDLDTTDINWAHLDIWFYVNI